MCNSGSLIGHSPQHIYGRKIKSRLAKNLIDLFQSIEECIVQKRILSALVLLYSGIDVVASLERGTRETVRDAFVRWSDEYLLKAYQLGCTSLELYAARCGVVHTFSAISELSRRRKVRQAIYAWGNQKSGTLDHAAKIIGHHDVVAVHVNDLVEGFRRAVAAYFDDLEKSNLTRQRTVTRSAGLWLTHMDAGPVQELLNAFQQSGHNR